MKLLMVVLGVIMLTGCEPSYKDYTESFTNLPEGLKDCKIYGIQNGNSMSLSVVRCPNSTVSTNQEVAEGKVTHVQTTTTIDGVEDTPVIK